MYIPLNVVKIDWIVTDDVSQPGLALLTLFLSRVEVIKQTIATSSDVVDAPSLEESQQWYAGSPGLDF